MANFLKREGGGCQARIRIKGHNENKTFYGRDGKTAEEQAAEWAERVENEIRAGLYDPDAVNNDKTLLEALNHYENKYAKFLKGYETEKWRIKKWREWKYINTKLSKLTEGMFNSYRDVRRGFSINDSLDENGVRKKAFVSDGSIRLDLAVISAIFKNTDYKITDPTKATVATLTSSKKRTRRLDGQEQEYLLAQVFDTQCSDANRSNKYLSLVVIFGLETSCRMAEIVRHVVTKEMNGTTTRVDKTTGLLRENIEFAGDSSTAQIFNLKNGSDFRFVPLSPTAVEAVCRAIELKPGKKGPVFDTTTSAVKQAFQRAKKRAIKQYIKDGGDDLEFLLDFHFHDLRHEAASRWKKYFTSIADLKSITGHKDPRSLFRYLNDTQDDVMNIAKTMAVAHKQNELTSDSKLIKFLKNQKTNHI